MEEVERTPENPPADPSNPVFRWALWGAGGITAVTFIILLAAATGLLTRDEASLLPVLIQWFLMLVVVLTAAYAASVAAHRMRLAWVLIASSAATGFAGIAVIVWFQVHLQSLTFDEDLFTLFLFVLVNGFGIAGLALMLPRATDRAAQLRVVLDSIIVGASIYLCFWGVAFRDLIAAGNGSLARVITDAMYPAIDATILTICFVMVMRAPGRSRPSLKLLLAAMAIPAVTDPVYSYFALQGNPWADTVGGLGAILSLVMLSLAALRSTRWDDDPPRKERLLQPLDQYFPMIPLGLAIAVIIISYVDNGALDPVLFWIGMGTVLLVVARLGMTLRENRTLNHQLDDAARFKTELLRFISHEVANPLSPLTLQLHRLDSADITDGDRRNLQIMSRSVKRLESLSRDIRILAELDAGRLVMERKSQDLVELAGAAVDAVQALAAQKGVEVTLEPPRKPLHAPIDAERIGQVLDNLLSNAIKFTQRDGRVKVRFEQVDDLAITVVEDTGLGMSVEQQEKLFQAFSRFHEKAAPGLGLGLYLCRNIVSAHGGRIWAESDGPQQGSRFFFAVPMTLAPLPAATARAHPIGND